MTPGRFNIFATSARSSIDLETKFDPTGSKNAAGSGVVVATRSPAYPASPHWLSYGRASKTRLNGFSVARRNWPNPASDTIWASVASGTWLPRA